ncbi:hypothetical protein [Rhodanobacter sp. DHG33]|uniref:hypothetical protein n=1 Tax=Rhodanobacter sp. DHG33 TaxID=2775921 RepID=UPI00178119C9|nr:hypothetical protein [Rhodanobacter sp. DHG33]MBD8899667.1 hypothetical protein [Rhodanobacter sp. DHG33]
MNYDQSWMGYGWTGGMEAGAISLVVGLVLYLVFHRIGRRNDWSDARQIGWSYFLAVVLTGRVDFWNLFYFNYARLDSLQVLQAKLADVHDPDGIGTRALCELLGAALGVLIAWVLCGRHWRQE